MMGWAMRKYCFLNFATSHKCVRIKCGYGNRIAVSDMMFPGGINSMLEPEKTQSPNRMSVLAIYSGFWFGVYNI